MVLREGSRDFNGVALRLCTGPVNGTGYQYNTQINATRCFSKGTEPVARWHCTQSLQRQKRHTKQQTIRTPHFEATVPKFWAVCQRSQRSHASQNSRESILSMPWKPFYYVCFVQPLLHVQNLATRPQIHPSRKSPEQLDALFLAQKPRPKRFDMVRLNCFNSCPKTSCPLHPQSQRCKQNARSLHLPAALP